MKPTLVTTKLLKSHAVRPIRKPHRATTAKGQACAAGPNGCPDKACRCTRKGRAVRRGQGKSNGNVDTQ